MVFLDTSLARLTRLPAILPTMFPRIDWECLEAGPVKQPISCTQPRPAQHAIGQLTQALTASSEKHILACGYAIPLLISIHLCDHASRGTHELHHWQHLVVPYI